MLNQCQFIGHLGGEPEIRTFENGDRVANLSLAVTEKWKDKHTGEKRERTEWIKIVVFGGLVKIVESFLRKGSRIFVQGQLQTRKWQDQQGQDKYTTEIVLQGFNSSLILLDSKQADASPQQSTGGFSNNSNPF